MNYLHRKIEAGEQVVIQARFFSWPMPVEERVFVCDGSGFGCNPDTSGVAIFGYWLDNPTKDTERMNGDMIDSAETKEWQEQNS